MKYGARELILLRTCDYAIVFCIAHQGAVLH